MLNQPTQGLSTERLPEVKFLLYLMRMGHTILGITPPRPEHERAFLLGWMAALLLVALLSVGLLVFLVPRIMR